MYPGDHPQSHTLRAIRRKASNEQLLVPVGIRWEPLWLLLLGLGLLTRRLRCGCRVLRRRPCLRIHLGDGGAPIVIGGEFDFPDSMHMPRIKHSNWLGSATLYSKCSILLYCIAGYHPYYTRYYTYQPRFPAHAASCTTPTILGTTPPILGIQHIQHSTLLYSWLYQKRFGL